MKQILCLLVALLILLACRPSKQEGGSVDISIPQNIYLGKVVVGKPVRLFVKCVNRGEKEARVREIDTPCACLQIVGRYVNRIQAQDSLMLEFTYVPEGLGYTEKNIKFYFNQSKEPSVLKLSAHIRDSVKREEYQNSRQE